MIEQVLLFMLFMFSVPIPVIPVILYHIGKGVWEDAKRWML